MNGPQEEGQVRREPDGLRERRERRADPAQERKSPAPAAGGAEAGDGSGTGPLGPLLRESAPPYRRTSGQIAAVLLYRNGGHRIVWPDRTDDVDKPLLRPPYTVFEVQLGRNITEFALRLPAAGDGSWFDVRVRIQWTVEDPYLVVREQAWNVAELLHDDLLDGLRSLSRRFRLTEAQRADEAVRDELASGRLVIGRDIGLRTQVYVFFDLAEQTRIEVARGDQAGVASGSDARVAERELRQEAWDRKRIEARAEALMAVFRSGDLAQIAHHMASNPDREWEIRTQLQREKREGQADLLTVFTKLLDAGVLERHEIDEQAFQVLQHLRGSTGAILGGVASQVLDGDRGSGRRALEPARPEPAAPHWDDEPAPEAAPQDRRIYEPTDVRPASGPDPYDDPYDARDRDRHDAPRSQPSDAFDDWDDE
ncbi:hypothetical protein KV205_33315 [Streptomyces sp. SKN60]|uniref:hypothetical protein n=1 Tax=Streptomyces sp. SKN60 TaxID=2855506 RepID=UPI0022477212|nr:hypothetical protein [Streptomyces sp. SKN60]MCX2185351.1 hypothetical protein [Streptomyces sp. SKN60]